MDENPMGYISKIGVDGITSLIGPSNVGRFRKSYIAGACNSMRSGFFNIRISAIRLFDSEFRFILQNL